MMPVGPLLNPPHYKRQGASLNANVRRPGEKDAGHIGG